MQKKMRERLIVVVAVIFLFAAFSAVAYFDRPHGTIGDDFGQDDFTVVMERNEGHVSIPDFPSDLLIFGAGQDASLDFTVLNNDEDNDIDTIYITIPDGEVVDATTEWYDPLFTHEWEFSAVTSDMAKISAQDDLPGRVFGGSAQYDVAGNIDDALDHNSTIGMSEGITITLEFITPSSIGTKVGASAIDLEVSDEQTEGSGASGRYSIDPFPHPYLVIDVDYEFILFELEGTNADLDIEWGGNYLFGSGSRASDFSTSEHGYRYISSNGNTVAVLNAPPAGTIVDPVITAKDNTGGQFVLDMVHFKTATINPSQPTSSWVTIEASQEDYTGDLPTTAGESVSLDIDGDGLFTDNDDDIDGDGIPNEQDTDPNDPGVANHHPTITSITPSATSIAKNKKLTIDVIAQDADTGDSLNYAWSVSPHTGWTGSGESVEVDLGDFEPGTYTFTVLVTDGNNGQARSSATVEVTEDDESGGLPIWVIILIILVILVVVGAVVFYVLKGGEEEEEIPEEMAPQPPEIYDEPIEDLGYDSPFQAEDVPVQDDYYPESIMDESEEEAIEDEQAPPSPEDDVQLPDESEMQEVNDLESLIDEMERTEEEIGDVCPECDAPLGPYDSKCGNCGAQFELALECPNCGAVVEEDVPNCPGCGIEFN